jgi:hypothetical protein
LRFATWAEERTMNYCPTPEELRGLLEGPDDGPAAEAFAAHLEGCRACQEALEELTAGGQCPAATPAASTDPVALPQTVKGAEDFLRRLAKVSAPPSLPQRDALPATRSDHPTMPHSAPESGTMRQFIEPGTLIEKCRLESLLGYGGMGEVYLAEHTVLGNKVAVKVLPAQRVGDAEALRRFLREVRVQARMKPHANVAVAFDAGEYQGRHYLVMEYIPGVDLQEHIVRDVEALMKPGTSALFVLDDDGDMEVILHAIRGLGGTVLKTNVDLERAKLIQSTLAAASSDPIQSAGQS